LAGRHGEPGSSRVFVCLSDHSLYMGLRLRRTVAWTLRSGPLEAPRLSRAIRRRQEGGERIGLQARGALDWCDDLVDQQSADYFSRRQRVLQAVNDEDLCSAFSVDAPMEMRHCTDTAPTSDQHGTLAVADIATGPCTLANHEALRSPPLRNVLRRSGETDGRTLDLALVVKDFDELWLEHLVRVLRIRDVVVEGGYPAGRDPEVLFKDDLEKSYHQLLARMATKLRDVLDGRAGVVQPGVAVPGRNDPCPCGSGRDYKKCCGPRQSGHRPVTGPS
jgi:preprotein translocase subunit SecA